MIKTLRAVILVSLCAGCVTTTVSRKVEQNQGCNWESYSMNSQDFVNFHKKFVKKTKEESAARNIASLISYPLVVINKGQPRIYQNSKEVQKDYKKIFTSDVISAVQSQNPNEVSCSFKGVAYDEQKILISIDENKKFKIYSIKNL